VAVGEWDRRPYVVAGGTRETDGRPAALASRGL